MKRGLAYVADLKRGTTAVNKVYRGTSIVWQRTIEMQYLVLAGGGGGGVGYKNDWGGGGGGAGGYRSSVVGEISGRSSSAEPTLFVSSGTYPIVVGAGGTGGLLSHAYPGKGGDSSAFNVVSIGGGYGANGLYNAIGGNGGSGGGPCYKNAGATGTAGYGTAGQGYDGYAWPGRGGPGGGAGGPAAAINPWDGGVGITSSITGVATTRGAGGQGDTGGPVGPANSGNGGCGLRDEAVSGRNGGSGIVIIRYPGTVAKATGGTITYISGYVVHTFTASGNFVI